VGIRMIDVSAAQQFVLRHARCGSSVTIPFGLACLDHTLAADIRATGDSPPFDKSMMDGYAVRAADVTRPGVRLRVTGMIPAGGTASTELLPNHAVRIFTGAPMPSGADAVVKQEDVTREGDEIEVSIPVQVGQNIVRRGSDMATGNVVLPRGTRIRPAVLGLLATLGCTSVPAVQRPTVSVLATGSELVGADQPLVGSQIRNSNGPMLAGLAQVCGASILQETLVPDDPDLLRAAIQSTSTSDVLILSGGVSVGDFDHVPKVLGELGLFTHFHQVKMKPGKPVLFGTLGSTLVFGLPGNPLSAFVCFHLFVRPALQAMLGGSPNLTPERVPLTADCHSKHDRPTYAPAKLHPHGVEPLPWQGSSTIRALVEANALQVLPAGMFRVKAGETVPVLPLFDQ
jgi:molybdopterin molybdotransferase